MTIAHERKFRVLFLCTGNSARSQMAEALLKRKGHGRFEVESAGAAPAAQVHPLAIQTLREHGFAWTDRRPRDLAGLDQGKWDFIIDRLAYRLPPLLRGPVG